MALFIEALVPILALILLGLLLQRFQFLSDHHWAGIEKLTYYLLFPALLIEKLATQSIETLPWMPMLLVIIASLSLPALLLGLWHHFRQQTSNPTFTSIFQGGVRFNAYITLAVAQGLYGTEGLMIGSAAIGFIIMIINLLCVGAFSIWGKENRTQGLRPFLRTLTTNPLILACASGWLLNITGAGLTPLLDETLTIIGSAALPLGLLAVGSALRLEKVQGHLHAITLSSFFQFGFKPLLTTGVTLLLGLPEMVAAILLIAFMTPTAPSSYILARQLGGDTETMASIITFQTLIAFVLMPLLAALLLP